MKKIAAALLLALTLTAPVAAGDIEMPGSKPPPCPPGMVCTNSTDPVETELISLIISALGTLF